MRRLTTSILLALIAFLAGCRGNQREWEVAVENKTDVPCSVSVTLGGSGAKGGASVDNVVKDQTFVLVAGPSSTVVETIKVTRAGATETLTPKASLTAGKRYTIIIAPTGVETKVE